MKKRAANYGVAANCSVPGSATSAAKMRKRVGIMDRAGYVYIPGEGWVKWVKLKADVARAYDRWRWRKAMMGIKIYDGSEAVQAGIDAAMERRRAA